jgi:uncharacterized DUF497 family protein
MQFEWDSDKAEANLARHGVSFDEAIEVFNDENALIEFDADHSEHEDRFIIVGLSSRRLLFVIYVEREAETLRLIHARKAPKKYREIYEQEES